MTENQKPEPVISGDVFICENQTGQLTLEVFEQYEWSTNQNTQSIEISSSGVYMVTVTDANGCTGETFEMVELQPNPLLNVIGDTSILFGESIELSSSGAGSYFWTPSENLSCSDCGSPVAMPKETTTYTVTGANEFGCLSMASLTVEVLQNDSIKLDPIDAFTPNGDGVNETFLIRGLENFPNSKLIVFNRWGSEVYEAINYQNDWDGTYNGKPLPEGSYLFVISITRGSKVETQKGVITIIRS